ncbi:Uncharacterised protein [Mycobacteroides abscessus subsp. abscessus]|nr:Uncharacterised protein [Mycobacteroides abscessus subsp. abscessus]
MTFCSCSLFSPLMSGGVTALVLGLISTFGGAAAYAKKAPMSSANVCDSP